MSIQSVGTATSQKIVFNSGHLTVNGSDIADVKDVTVTKTFDVKDYRALNTILKRALRRTNPTFGIKCTMVGLVKEAYSLFFSASSPVSAGTEYTTLDSSVQNTMTCYLTVYRDDDPTKAYQYQLVHPVFSNMSDNLPTDDFGTMGVEIMCVDMKLDVNTTTEA